MICIHGQIFQLVFILIKGEACSFKAEDGGQEFQNRFYVLGSKSSQIPRDCRQTSFVKKESTFFSKQKDSHPCFCHTSYCSTMLPKYSEITVLNITLIYCDFFKIHPSRNYAQRLLKFSLPHYKSFNNNTYLLSEITHNISISLPSATISPVIPSLYEGRR